MVVVYGFINRLFSPGFGENDSVLLEIYLECLWE